MTQSSILSLGLLLVLSLAGCASEDTTPAATDTDSQRTQKMASDESSQSPSMKMHALMMQPMKDMHITGNVDKDFAKMMADHHLQAIEMAKIEVANSQNDHMKEMAQKMIESQTKERERLLQIAESEPSTPTNADAASQLHDIMMRPMPNMQMTDNIDRDFSAMMAFHHQGAIDMAKIEIEHGKNPELKKMAQKMTEDQQKEKEMLDMHAKG